MKELTISRMAVMLAAAGTILSLSAATATAQAQTVTHSRHHVGAAPAVARPSSVRPYFTCPSATVCVFPNNDLTGNYGSPWNGPAELTTVLYSGQWDSFSSISITPNPGSLNDNSGSCVWVLDKEAGVKSYVEPGDTGVLAHSYGYIFIQYGVNPCNPNDPPSGS
jgi:hypothetical protein